MQVSRRDFIILFVMAAAFSLIGFGIGWKTKPVVLSEEDSKFVKIYAQMDSLKLIIKNNLAHVDTLYTQIKTLDINRNNNFKNLANELKQVRRFNTTTRSKYLDSLAAVEGL